LRGSDHAERVLLEATFEFQPKGCQPILDRLNESLDIDGARVEEEPAISSYQDESNEIHGQHLQSQYHKMDILGRTGLGHTDGHVFQQEAIYIGTWEESLGELHESWMLLAGNFPNR
jgi:hypothetical protein